ncbi:hypothetical protein Egran_05344 [Elaphomyces granulatus]|uniref:Major facilitator superfamily (MFS) profile domain-containing protein n=1 Tax=Elaphomyces granulatus TaxID=519963 RepID=A0A232LRX5_9EURO|nr:hypothetical protein Egran_05344 [Elaphomyces granulatus]
MEKRFSGLPVEGDPFQLAQRISVNYLWDKPLPGGPFEVRSNSVSSSDSSQEVKARPDWSNDPRNALNWRMWKKVYNSSVPALLSFASSFGSSVYSPAVFEVEARFNVSTTMALLPLTLYVFGLGFGPVIGAPLSETYGRRFVYLVTPPLSMLFTVGSALSKNFGTLLACRFLAGMMGSPPLAVGAGTNIDMWPVQHRARAVSLYLFAPFLGPSLGPAIGGYLAQYKGWQWTQWIMVIIGGAIWAYSLGSEETYGKVILKKEAKKLGLPPESDDGPKGLAAIKLLLTVTITRPIHMLFTEPIVALYSIYTAFNFAVLFIFFEAFPIVFMGVYGFSLGECGLSFMGITVGCLLSVAVSNIVDRLTHFKKLQQKIAAGGEASLPPEQRLHNAMIGSLLLPIGLFWFAWTARHDNSSALYLVEVYGPLNGASAIAANGLLRYALGGSFPLFAVQMYQRLGIGWATSLLGFITVSLLPVPWLFFLWGPRIRERSKFKL